MLKLTDPKYRLPYIEALADFNLMETGTTEPMGIRGVDIHTGKRGQYVVKYVNSSRMTAKSSCRELLGGWMAREIDIQVVEPVIVNISGEFVKLLLGKNGYQSALKSIGQNFGSVYEAGYNLFPNMRFSLDSNMLEQAKMVFMFDMFIANADRGAGKPNVLSNGTDLMVLDHELAFSFADILAFLRSKTPWIIGIAEREMYERHYFYPLLRRQEVDFSQQVDKLVAFNGSFWDKALSLIPTQWRTEELDTIKLYLDSIVDNRSVFATELTKILAT